MNNAVFKGYHITDSLNCTDIINNKFISKHNPKHYLGQGIYFFSDFEVAKLNIINCQISYGKTSDKSIIECNIETPINKVLDLDKPSENTAFREFWNKCIEYIKENNIQLQFETEKDFNKNKKLYYKCYILDLYKAKNDYSVIIKTFSSDSPDYGVPILNLKFSGLPYIEKYLCVTDNVYIKNKKAVYSTTIKEALFI